MFAGIFGLRRHTVDLKKSMNYKTWDFRKRMENANSLSSEEAFSDATGSAGRLSAVLRQTDKQRRDIFHQLHLDAQALIDHGIPRSEVRRIMRNNRVSQANVNLVMRDEYAPYDLSDRYDDISRKKYGKEKVDNLREFQRGLRR